MTSPSRAAAGSSFAGLARRAAGRAAAARPQRAGKSSLPALAGILSPAAGRIVRRRRLHLVAHAAGVKAHLTLDENLAFWRAVNGPTAAPRRRSTPSAGGLGGIAAGI